jgi:hypothetical protein
MITLSKHITSHSQWSAGYHACQWTQGSWVQTWLRQWAIRIHSTPSLGWEVKPEDPCRKILWHVTDPLRYFQILNRQNSHSFVHSSYLLQQDSASRMARELWWTSQQLSPATIITITTTVNTLHTHISPEA